MRILSLRGHWLDWLVARSAIASPKWSDRDWNKTVWRPNYWVGEASGKIRGNPVPPGSVCHVYLSHQRSELRSKVAVFDAEGTQLTQSVLIVMQDRRYVSLDEPYPFTEAELRYLPSGMRYQSEFGEAIWVDGQVLSVVGRSRPELNVDPEHSNDGLKSHHHISLNRRKSEIRSFLLTIPNGKKTTQVGCTTARYH